MAPFIVLSGDAGAGKDSIAKYLVNVHGWTLYSLSGPLKRFAHDMFGFTDEQLYGPSSARNAPDSRWERPCPWCTGGDGSGNKKTPGWSDWARTVPCTECAGAGKLNDNSPRRVLQLLGSEYLREMIHPDALTIRATPDIAKLLSDSSCRGVVVNDARYTNDRDNLHDWLGAARVDVRVVDPTPKPGDWRRHQSELDRPLDTNVEYVFLNDEEHPFPGLPRHVDRMLDALQFAP